MAQHLIVFILALIALSITSIHVYRENMKFKAKKRSDDFRSSEDQQAK